MNYLGVCVCVICSIFTQRGKFRPRLTELVKENKSEEVEAVTKSAFKKMPSVEAAIKHLCQLKAVGPATASGKCGRVDGQNDDDDNNNNNNNNLHFS